MKNLKEKKGISLIVLIITIIIMIILATAIILSLSNSGIIGKASKAKNDSDTANLKEYVNVLEAEYELMSETERGGKTGIEYVNSKLAEKGYTQALLMPDGTLYTNLQANTKSALEEGIKIGDVVTGYTLDTGKTSYTTSGNENTAPSETETDPTSQTVTRTEYVTWKYIGIGENGELLIAPDMVSSAKTIKLSGIGGFLDGTQELNDMCEAMYSTSKGTARSMNINDIIRILDYTGDLGKYSDHDDETHEATEFYTPFAMKISEIGDLIGRSTGASGTLNGIDIVDYYSDSYSIAKNEDYILNSVEDDNLKTVLKDFVYSSESYWLASTFADAHFGYGGVFFGFRTVGSNGVSGSSPILFECSGDRFGFFSFRLCYAFRPVVSLNSDVHITVSDGNWSI